jgi:transaldolase
LFKARAAPFTVNTMPEATLKALANQKALGSILPADGGDCEEALSQFAHAGINIDASGKASERGSQVVHQVMGLVDGGD